MKIIAVHITITISLICNAINIYSSENIIATRERSDSEAKSSAIFWEHIKNYRKYDAIREEQRQIAQAKINAEYEKNFLPFEQAIKRDDIQTVTQFFQQGMDPNQKRYDLPLLWAVKRGAREADPEKDCGRPLFWHIKSRSMARSFVDHGVDIHQSGYLYPNVLWWLLDVPEPNMKLVRFYLRRGVSVKKINPYGKCILHILATPMICPGTKEQATAVDVLLESCPTIVNHLDNYGETALDLALNRRDCDPYLYDPYLIGVLKKYGAKRSAKLKQQKACVISCE